MNKKIQNFWFYYLPLMLWMAFIFVLSSVPGPSIPKFKIPDFHLIVHVIEYSLLGILSIRAGANQSFKTGQFKGSIFCIFLIMIFAASDEWHQSFVIGRSGQIMTVWQDTLYAIAGIGMYWDLKYLFKRN